MPEHVKLLNDVQFDANKTSKPQLEEQQLEELQIVIMESHHYTLPIKISTWENGFTNHMTAIVDTLDMIKKEIRVEIQTDYEMKCMLIEKIIAAERI
ncbi:YolD-like family protein [Cytobacillus horneckiae]|uniref:YolD-like family protein n=1 Tax=Cytobacillus horneckiae TaxID=549687 RepID=A0A2N0ZB48_9BACI|nr:YolD-like family protein [Cytobacillus horneckiae]MEC1155536.1 YolD-like family protein [Cytobacillus horneckiae]MED2936855.1 YolD-like family protein [Cytobacillus horneckiae]PKG26726.1 YolD-like family protein [Cytobacillus horneckiae]